MPTCPELDERCVLCEVGDGLPTVTGKARGYYIFRYGGPRALILERRLGDRLRINSATDIVILEIRPDQVKFAIEYLPDGETRIS